MDKQQQKHRLVVVGAGFGGLETINGLKNAGLDITLIDRRNHHLFQPLLYQVATTSLATSEVAWPVRQLMRRREDVTTLLGAVTGVDAAGRRVMLENGEAVAYDTLVIATGARHSYFGHDEWEPFAPGLKTIEDATAIRRRILLAFERAERETDANKRAALLTFVVIGAGPTGVELAGTIADLARDTLKGEFRRIDPGQARVVLVEAGQRVLANFRDRLSDYARRALEQLGVEIMLGRPVTAVDGEGVTIDGERLPARTVLWAAGVAASPAAEWLGVKADRAGRVMVEPDLTAPGHSEIFVIGDTAHLEQDNGKPVPGVAPAAKQQGRYVARALRNRVAGRTAGPPFRYRSDGDLATIGKRAAVVDFGWITLTGWPAWWLWGLAHIYFLIGLRYRLAVALSWLWIYATGQRSARLITQGSADVEGVRPVRKSKPKADA